MDEMGKDKTDVKASEGAGSIASIAKSLKEISPPPSPEHEGEQPSPENGGDHRKPNVKLTPKTIERLCKMPGNTMYALTKSDIWLVDKEEIEVLATNTQEFLEIVAQIDSRLLIGGAFFLSWAAVYGTRTLAYITRSKKKEAEKPVRADRGGADTEQKSE